MAHAQALNHVPRSCQAAPFVEVRQSFPSQVQVISQFVDQLMPFILNFRSADGSEIDIETALREALTNAVVHGNRENPSKHVYVECRCYTDGEVSITVRDEGPGFDTSAVPDPTTPENRLFEHGRGIYLMKTLMDEVWFEESGTVVQMRMKSEFSRAATGFGYAQPLLRIPPRTGHCSSSGKRSPATILISS